MSRLLNLSLAILGIALVPATLRAFDVTEPLPAVPEAVEVVAPDEAALPEVEEPLEDGLLAANWTFVGCIYLGGGCKDVFADAAGDYWVCKACGTTNHPGPGKCRRLTQYEINNSPWCS